MREPIILLERCDKIWETLKLIKNIQQPDVIDITDSYNEEKEEKKRVNELKQSVTNVKRQSTLSNSNSSVQPLQFSVKKTKKVFPCVVCGKHYMEKRSLRHHSARIHGIIIPLERAYCRRIPRQINKKEFKKNNATTSINAGNSNFEKFDNKKSMYSEVTSVVSTKYPTMNSSNRTSNADTSNTNPNADTPQKTEIKLLPGKRKRNSYRPPCYERYLTCVLCKRRVASLEKHLTQYHKVGCPKHVLKYLQSPAQAPAQPPRPPPPTTTKNGEPSEERKKLKNILSGRIPQCPTSINGDMQDKSYAADHEKKSHGTSQVKKKRKYTLSYAMTQKSASNITYKCEICLGIYASLNSLQKHRRRHRMRGETKENFNRFKCRYINSPLNKKYQLSKSSLNLNNTTVGNTRKNRNTDLRLSNSKKHILLGEKDKVSKINQVTKYNQDINKNNETICICGRTFRNSHNLFIHKRQCKLCKQEDTMIQSVVGNGDDKNSDVAINITIKKRNDSYEIVGKANDENACNESDIYKNSNLSLDGNSAFKEGINAISKPPDILKLSDRSLKNNQNHSILKLEVIDEDDTIIDIENDSQFNSIQVDEEQYLVTQVSDEIYLKKQQNNKIEDMENKKTFYSVRTLKEICQDMLNRSTSESENSVVSQENIRMLRSSVKREDCNFCN